MKVELGFMLALAIDALPVPANTLGSVVTDEPAAHREAKPGPMYGGPSRPPEEVRS